MGIYAHATHVFLPDNDTARVIAGALLKSPQSLVICKPYGKWINVYLQMGLSYKDCVEFPTATHVELNCYNSEGFDLRLFTQDRLAFLYESGAGDVGEEEEQLMEIAADLWEKKNPEAATAAREAAKSRVEGGRKEEAVKPQAAPAKEALGFFGLPESEQQDYVKKAGCSPDDEDAPAKAADLWAAENPEKAAAAKAAATSAAQDASEDPAQGAGEGPKDFWDLPRDEQETYITEARQSGVFQKYITESELEDDIPSCDPFAPFLPEGRGPVDLHALLKAMSGRLHGPPSDEKEKALLEKWMNGSNHSEKAEDYVRAIAAFFDVKGSLWSLETITEQLPDKIDRRIASLDDLSADPKPS